jgi:O-antigen/teichoic acid export membrane protein
LLGRFWGVEARGIYGRAYQLVNIPSDSLNSSAGGVIFAALSRLQDEAARLRSFFVKGYSLMLSITVPITLMCALFGNDIIGVFLGHKWNSAIPVFRLLAPTTLCLGIRAPLGWLLASCGLVGRGLRMTLVTVPILVTAYALGMPWGPKGVATAYSAAMILLVVPMIAWARRGTPVLLRDLLLAIGRPPLSGIAAGGLAFGLQFIWSALRPLPRLMLSGAVVSSVYLGVLLYVRRQKHFFVEVLRGIFKSSTTEESAAISL